MANAAAAAAVAAAAAAAALMAAAAAAAPHHLSSSASAKFSVQIGPLTTIIQTEKLYEYEPHSAMFTVFY